MICSSAWAAISQAAIGGALVTNPSVLILNEPTEGIQPNIIQQIELILMKIAKEKKIPVLIFKQYLDFARRIGDSYYILDGGKFIDEGDMNNIDREKIERYLPVRLAGRFHHSSASIQQSRHRTPRGKFQTNVGPRHRSAEDP